jgi:hypothetical protein
VLLIFLPENSSLFQITVKEKSSRLSVCCIQITSVTLFFVIFLQYVLIAFCGLYAFNFLLLCIVSHDIDYLFLHCIDLTSRELHEISANTEY